MLLDEMTWMDLVTAPPGVFVRAVTVLEGRYRTGLLDAGFDGKDIEGQIQQMLNHLLASRLMAAG